MKIFCMGAIQMYHSNMSEKVDEKHKLATPNTLFCGCSFLHSVFSGSITTFWLHDPETRTWFKNTK